MHCANMFLLNTSNQNVLCLNIYGTWHLSLDSISFDASLFHIFGMMISVSFDIFRKHTFFGVSLLRHCVSTAFWLGTHCVDISSDPWWIASHYRLLISHGLFPFLAGLVHIACLSVRLGSSCSFSHNCNSSSTRPTTIWSLIISSFSAP